MKVIALDTLAYANKLKEGGMEARLADIQAEETARILNDLSTNQLATKNDIALMKNDLKETELRIIKWMIGIVFGQTAFLVSIMHFTH